MPNENQLSTRILDVLKEASGPLLAKDIAISLCQKYGLNVTKKDVNPVLYGTLAAQVQKDSETKWSLTVRKKTTEPQQQRAEVEPPQTAEDRHTRTDLTATNTTPSCPKCGKPMVLRAAKRGPNAGGQFYGCSDYPRCKGTLDVEKEGGEKVDIPMEATQPNGGQNPSDTPPPPPASQPPPVSPQSTDEPAPEENGSPCPDCGAPMQIRTARRGGNAGGQFYGCSRYPQCKATLPIDGDTHDQPPQRTQRPRAQTDHPRRIAAFPTTSTTMPTYFECVALPSKAVSASIIDGIPQSHLRALCQWQLDLPQTTEPHSVSQLAWLPVVEKILKRGRAIPLSPSLESELRAIAAFPQVEAEQWEETLKIAAVGVRPAPRWSYGFGSDEERLFIDRVLPAISGQNIIGWVQRQVALDGLVNADDHEPTDRRVDFLISHPWGLQLVVEIDGAQHGEQVEADKSRDADLLTSGYEVIRIPAHEVRDGAGESLKALRNRLSGIRFDDHDSNQRRFLSLVRRAHQLQMSLWYACAMGLVAIHEVEPIKVSVCLDDGFVEISHRFTNAVLNDLNDLIGDVASLYGETEKRAVFEHSSDPVITIQFTTDYTAATTSTLFVRDVYLPLTVSTEVSAFAPANAVNVAEATCKRLLKRIFGFDSFREGQLEAIARCLGGDDAIVLLPTGAGKSVAFQLSALLRPGVCIVIDPIISLIEDQIENLRGFGIDRICQITSALEWEGRRAILDLLARGEFQFCYVAPERFQDQRFRDSLRVLTTHTAISLVTIDEAHCVSEWGHDFRPAYLNIARISRDYCATDGVAPPLMALTGTASRAVLKDVQRELQIGDFEAIITPSTFDRAELHFRTMPCRSNEKILRLRGLLESIPRQFSHTPTSFFECRGGHTHSGLVFCPHVEGDFGVVRVSEEVARSLNRKVPFYSGSAPKGITEQDWRKNKTLIAREFKRNHVPLMACTKAFGMGIDKPNIRYTVHYGIPASIEAFYQEAGRAGRDRRDAQCFVLYSNDMPDRTKELLNPSVSMETLHAQMDSVNWDNADDITRVLWFHTHSFAGVESDYQNVVEAIEEIGDLTEPSNVVLEFSKDEKTMRERAIHRLLTIGVIADYTVNYSAGQFHARLTGFDAEQIADCLYRYIAAYQRGQAKVAVQRLQKHLDLPHEEFVRRAARELIQFVYEVIERSRRQALSEMLALCEQCSDEDAIRQRLLTYLGTSGFTSVIDEILDTTDGGLKEALVILEEIRSAIDASQLRGESGRALESYPDHTGLRLVRAISEAMAVSPNRNTVSENVEACVRFGHDKYGLELRDIATHIVAAIRIAADARPELAGPIVVGMIDGADDRRAAARIIVRDLPSAMIGHGVASLLDGLNSRLTAILEN